IITVNVIPPDHDHDVPVVKPNQHDDVPVVPEPGLEDEDEDPEEDDMEIDIEEDENEPELTYPYEEVDPLNPPSPAFESEPDNEVEVENPIEHELLPGFMRWDIDSLFGRMVNFLRRFCGREMAHALVKNKEEAKDRFYGKLILDLGNEVCSSVEQGTTAIEKLVNERVERDLYWTRVQAHEFYQEMIHRGFVFDERPNEAIDVLIEDGKSPLSEPQGSPPDM
ncbi:hypothetical protein Tco_1470596, partial [Tanacetum coccineum]